VGHSTIRIWFRSIVSFWDVELVCG
jgi:hypothetical protein